MDPLPSPSFRSFSAADTDIPRRLQQGFDSMRGFVSPFYRPSFSPFDNAVLNPFNTFAAGAAGGDPPPSRYRRNASPTGVENFPAQRLETQSPFPSPSPALSRQPPLPRGTPLQQQQQLQMQFQQMYPMYQPQQLQQQPQQMHYTPSYSLRQDTMPQSGFFQQETAADRNPSYPILRTNASPFPQDYQRWPSSPVAPPSRRALTNLALYRPDSANQYQFPYPQDSPRQLPYPKLPNGSASWRLGPTQLSYPQGQQQRTLKPPQPPLMAESPFDAPSVVQSGHSSSLEPCRHQLCERIRSRSRPNHSPPTVGVLLVGTVGMQPCALLTRGPLEMERGYGLTAGCRILDPSDNDCYVHAAKRILEKDAGLPLETSSARINFILNRGISEGNTTGKQILIGIVEEQELLRLGTHSPITEQSATRLFRVAYDSSYWRTFFDSSKRKVSNTVRTVIAQVHVDQLFVPSTVPGLDNSRPFR